MRIHRLLAATILFTLFASCSGPSQQPGLPEAQQDLVPIEPDQDIAPAEPDEDIIMPTAFPEDAPRDACLEGFWTMETADLDLLVSIMVQMENFRVPQGFLTMDFYPDGHLRYTGDMTLQIDFTENWYLQGIGGFRSLGTYASEEDLILFNIEAVETEVFEWLAYKDGRSAEQPGGGPEFSLTLPGAAPYRCTAKSLEIDTVNTAGDTVTMFFVR